MNIDRVILMLSGSLILISLLLSQIHSAHWLWFTALVGASLLLSRAAVPILYYMDKRWEFAHGKGK